jgi:hypothetical protein
MLRSVIVTSVALLAAQFSVAQMLAPDLHGTFLQLEKGNLTWTEEQWEKEFRAMKAVGMQVLIIQHIADKDFAFYRSGFLPLFQPCGTSDPLATLLALARKHRFSVWLGLDASADVARNLSIAREVRTRYGRFWDVVRGWYVFGALGELMNAPHPLDPTVRAYAAVIPELKRITPLPVMIAPAFTLDVSPDALAKGWERLFAVFRPDVMAVQDGIGCGRNLTPQNIRPYFAALKEVCDRYGVRLWSDLEIFDIPSGWRPAPIDRIAAQFAAVRDLVDKVVIFEFNHYMSPVRGNLPEQLYQDWQKRFFPAIAPIAPDERKERLRKCVHFLRSLFVPEVKLVREHMATQVCWLSNDNWLVVRALRGKDEALAMRLFQGLRSFNAPVPKRLQALFDPSVSVPPFRTSRLIDVTTQGNWLIRNEVDDGEVMDDWHEYADLLCIAAINAAKRGKWTDAQRLVAKVAAMWDGMGIVDKVTQRLNRYATYKLALLLWAAREAKVVLPFASELERRLWQMQHDNGGITTDYDRKGNPVGTQNAETTAFILSAFQ